MKIFSFLFFFFSLSFSVAAETIKFDSVSGRMQNLTNYKNSDLEIRVQLSKCGSSWGGWYGDGSSSCDIKKSVISNIDGAGYFYLRSSSLRIGSGGGKIRAYVALKNSEYYQYVTEIPLTSVSGFTLLDFPEHSMKLMTTDGQGLTEWNATRFGPDIVDVTRKIVASDGTVLLDLKPNTQTWTRETSFTLGNNIYILPRFLNPNDEIKLIYKVNPHSAASAHVTLAESTLTLAAKILSVEELPKTFVMDPTLMNYSISGEYSEVLFKGIKIGLDSSLKCINEKLSGNINIHGELVPVQGVCGKGFANFSLETRIIHLNFKGTVYFKKVVNNSVCGSMVNILDNDEGRLCLVRK